MPPPHDQRGYSRQCDDRRDEPALTHGAAVWTRSWWQTGIPHCADPAIYARTAVDFEPRPEENQWPRSVHIYLCVCALRSSLAAAAARRRQPACTTTTSPTK